jgi:BioD-like phosphotransacetylase family protein
MILLVASSEPRVGRSVIAAALAYRLARDGAEVTLARLAGDDSAAPDAAIFGAIDELQAVATPVSADDLKSLPGDVIVEAPPGSFAALASSLGARVLAVSGPSSPALDAPRDALVGTIVTRAPQADVETLGGRAGVLGVIAEDRALAAPSLDDIAEAVSGRWLHRSDEPQSIGRVMIGTVASDSGSPYFANREKTCVITRFDKTDIQLAALLTDLQCLVITGGGEPSPYLLDRVVNRADPVSVLLTDTPTVQAMGMVEDLYGRSRFDGETKLLRAVELLDEANIALPLPVAS